MSMPPSLFTLANQAFEIPGRGTAVLTGIQVSQPFTIRQGESLMFWSPFGIAISARVTAVEYARKRPGEEYALVLEGVSPSDLPAGSVAFRHADIIRDRDVCSSIQWTGDLDDDCTARWAGLMLRAEEMSERIWWWAVSDETLGGVEIASSNEVGTRVDSGIAARHAAESAARSYLSP